MIDLPDDVPSEALERCDRLIIPGQRRLLGLVGPPGAGKSTLAAALHAARPTLTQIVPMDGFHLANTQLKRLGREGRKGAPDTFDVSGFANLLQRLRQQQANDTIYAPDYRREIEEAVASAIVIEPHVPLLIVEGNYLLLDTAPWRLVAEQLHEVWYIDIDDALRTLRLTERHQRFGRSPEAAKAWVTQTDAPNAELIAEGRGRADWRMRWPSMAVSNWARSW